MKILIFISFLFIPSFSLAQNVSGNVDDFHFNQPLEIVSVTLKNNATGEILGTDSTNLLGNYSIDYVIVSVNQINNLPDDYNLSNAYPNPFNPSTRIDFSAPLQGKFTARIYNIIGQLVYTRDFTIDAGNHSFNISGLVSAGVYLFNLSSDDFTSTQKLILLDGGSANIKVELTGASRSRINKINIDELLIEFRKEGYIGRDTVISWQMNLVVNGEISQIPKQDTIWFYTSQNLIPTNTAANNASVVGSANGSTLFSGVTNNNGEFETFFIANYISNPNDTTQKVYTPGLVLVNVSRSNAVGESQEFVVDGSDISWMNDLQQVPISKTYNYSIFVQNSSNGQGVSEASVTGKKTSNDSLMVTKTTDTQGYANGTDDYLGYENDPSGLFNFVGNMTWTASKNQFNSNSLIVPFSSNIADTVAISPVPPPTRSWEWRVMDPLDNALNPTIFVKNQEGEIFTFNPQTNGVYNISIPTFGNSVKVWWSHSDLQEIGYIMPPDKQGQDLNIAQNERVAAGSLDTLTVSNINLLEQYQFTKLKMLHNVVDGRDMKSLEVYNILGRAGSITSRFMEEPSLNLPQLDIVIKAWYEWNNQIITPSDSSRLMTITSNVASLIKDLNYEIHYIYDENAPIWQDILARGADNAVTYQYKLGTPGNIVSYKFASNGLIRNKYGEGWATQTNSDATWAAEIMQPMFSLDDPDAVQGLGPWIYVNGVGPTQFARYIASYISEADNQKYRFNSTSKLEKELIEDPFTSTPTWGNVKFHYKGN